MINILQINNLSIKNALKIILAIQFVVWGMIGLNAEGVQIPIIRQLFGFIYLTFIPGILLLRILKLHKLSNIKTLLYIVGLSISTVMFIGLFMNMVFPFFGVSGPISIMPLIIMISAIVIILCVIAYITDNDITNSSNMNLENVPPSALFLCLIPFLSILGTYLVNFYKTNIVLIILIIVIALVAGLIAFNKFIPQNLYPFAVLMIAIALLLFSSLINIYIPPWDIHREYYFANMITTNCIWDLTISSNISNMLSIVMLAPIYSILLDMNLTWVFKVIYPVIYSFMPLGLYYIYQNQINDKTAFFSCFFFMSIFTFFMEMVELARQEIAELFLVLLIVVMIDKHTNAFKKKILSIIFSVSMIVSHYGISYVFILGLVFTWLVLGLISNPTISKLWNTYELNKSISANFVLLYITFAVSWYMYVSSSSSFNTIVYIGSHIFDNIYTSFLDPSSTQALNILVSKTASPLHDVAKYLQVIAQIFIAVGIFKLILKHKEMRFLNEYTIISVINFMLCIACIIVPHLSGALNTTRIYHITLIFLAPFCVMGGGVVLGGISRPFNQIFQKFPRIQYFQKTNSFIYIYLLIFFLFNTGIVYEIAGDVPQGPIGMPNNMKNNEINTIDFGYVYEYDASSAIWSSQRITNKNKIYADYIANEMVLISYGMQPFGYGHGNDLPNMNFWDIGSYIYLRYTNIIKGIIVSNAQVTWNTTDVLPPYDRTNIIFTNGGSEIYYYK